MLLQDFSEKSKTHHRGDIISVAGKLRGEAAGKEFLETTKQGTLLEGSTSPDLLEGSTSPDLDANSLSTVFPID